MMRKDFACIVISHGRPECSTVKVLRECGYTGKIYIVVSDEDKTLPDYVERYGNDVYVFHKEECFDTGDLGGSMACGVFARNQCLKECAYILTKHLCSVWASEMPLTI